MMETKLNIDGINLAYQIADVRTPEKTGTSKTITIPGNNGNNDFFDVEHIRKQVSRSVAEQINSDVFDGVKTLRHDCSSFSQLEIEQCYDYLKHNGYTPYFNDGFLYARK